MIAKRRVLKEKLYRRHQAVIETLAAHARVYYIENADIALLDALDDADVGNFTIV